MDLKSYAPSKEDVVVEIKVGDKQLYNEDKTPMTITLMSPFSEKARRVTYEMTDRRFEQLRKESENEGKVKTYIDMETLEKLKVEALAKITSGWNITWDGQKPKLTESKAKEIYSELFWLVPLLERERDKVSDFT